MKDKETMKKRKLRGVIEDPKKGEFPIDGKKYRFINEKKGELASLWKDMGEK